MNEISTDMTYAQKLSQLLRDLDPQTGYANTYRGHMMYVLEKCYSGVVDEKDAATIHRFVEKVLQIDETQKAKRNFKKGDLIMFVAQNHGETHSIGQFQVSKEFCTIEIVKCFYSTISSRFASDANCFVKYLQDQLFLVNAQDRFLGYRGGFHLWHLGEMYMIEP